MSRSNRIEKVLWGIALPGFPQILNGKVLKGFLFIFLEFLINIQSNLNQVIIESFYGEIQKAISITDYRWLMFYPCVYLFAVWDGYHDAGGGQAPFSYMPFVFSAYFGTIGVIYSPTLRIMGALMGPVWLPILFLFIGAGLGVGVRSILLLAFPDERRKQK
jgi:hypothetical protein